MVKFGNFLYHYRNFLFPVFYALLFVKSRPIFDDYRLALGIGLAVGLIGQLVRVLTVGLKYIIRGGKNRKVYAEDLVTDGIFAHSRNPLYVGNVLIIIGLGIMSNSMLFNLVMSPLFVLIYQFIIHAEEDFLRTKFGDAYEAYCKHTNRWLPKLKGLGETLSSMEFNWTRVITKEFTSAYIWLSGAVLLWMTASYRLESSETFQDRMPIMIAALVVLLSLYGLVKYLKATKRLVAE